MPIPVASGLRPDHLTLRERARHHDPALFIIRASGILKVAGQSPRGAGRAGPLSPRRHHDRLRCWRAVEASCPDAEVIFVDRTNEVVHVPSDVFAGHVTEGLRLTHAGEIGCQWSLGGSVDAETPTWN